MGQGDNHWCSLGFAEPTTVYKSGTQKARHLTEGWMAEHGFCPNCDADRLPALPNNSPVGDFRCAVCAEEYELKAKQGTLGSSLQAGAWSVMQKRLAAANNPNLFVMRYDTVANGVTDLIVVPRYFFTAAIVRPKNPTWPKGRSAPWLGSTILIGLVPDAGRISLIRSGEQVPQAEVRDRWRSTLFLRDAAAPARGWLAAVMKAVEAVGRDEFTIEDVYAQEATLAALYPGNNNVRPKIRQQLQVLRDRGWLAFGEKRGTYRLSG